MERIDKLFQCFRELTGVLTNRNLDIESTPSYIIELEEKDFNSINKELREYLLQHGFNMIHKDVNPEDMNFTKMSVPPNINIEFKVRKKKVPENY